MEQVSLLKKLKNYINWICLWISIFILEYFDEYAEEIPKGPTCEALSNIAKELGVVVVGGTLPERSNGKLYNTCTVWGTDGKILAMHRKVIISLNFG